MYIHIYVSPKLPIHLNLLSSLVSIWLFSVCVFISALQIG